MISTNKSQRARWRFIDDAGKSFDKTIAIQRRFASTELFIEGDLAQLEQMMLMLCLMHVMQCQTAACYKSVQRTFLFQRQMRQALQQH